MRLRLVPPVSDPGVTLRLRNPRQQARYPQYLLLLLHLKACRRHFWDLTAWR
jgi:hypothetical protein